MSFTVLDVLVMFGLVLSLFLVVLILSSKSFRSDVHRYFALTIISLNFCLTYTWFEEYVPANGIMEIISWDFLFPFSFMIYTLKAIKHPLAESKWIWLLVLPCLVLSGFQAVDFFFDFDLFDWLSGGNEETMMALIEIRTFSFVPFSIVLVGVAYVKVKKSQNIYPKERQWLEFNSMAILIFLFSWFFSDPIAEFFDFPIWQYLLALLAIFLVITTYLGIHQLNISEQRRQIKHFQVVTSSTPKITNAIRNHSSDISPKTAEKIQRLDQLMTDDRLYQNPELTRTMVAKKLGISDGYLSEIISITLNTNFNDYVNEFRVRSVIEMFENGKINLFSIEAIGFEAGFKTKSVFYNAFKKVTNQTPGAYLKAMNLS